jgi:hypothetical protein
MTENLSHTAKKLLARKKMRNLLLSAATASETDAIEREQAFLGSLLKSVREGNTDAAADVLANKIADLEKRKPANKIAEIDDKSSTKDTAAETTKVRRTRLFVCKR